MEFVMLWLQPGLLLEVLRRYNMLLIMICPIVLTNKFIELVVLVEQAIEAKQQTFSSQIVMKHWLVVRLKSTKILKQANQELPDWLARGDFSGSSRRSTFESRDVCVGDFGRAPNFNNNLLKSLKKIG